MNASLVIRGQDRARVSVTTHPNHVNTNVHINTNALHDHASERMDRVGIRTAELGIRRPCRVPHDVTCVRVLQHSPRSQLLTCVRAGSPQGQVTPDKELGILFNRRMPLGKSCTPCSWDRVLTNRSPWTTSSSQGVRERDRAVDIQG